MKTEFERADRYKSGACEVCGGHAERQCRFSASYDPRIPGDQAEAIRAVQNMADNWRSRPVRHRRCDT